MASSGAGGVEGGGRRQPYRHGEGDKRLIKSGTLRKATSRSVGGRVATMIWKTKFVELTPGRFAYADGPSVLGTRRWAAFGRVCWWGEQTALRMSSDAHRGRWPMPVSKNCAPGCFHHVFRRVGVVIGPQALCYLVNAHIPHRAITPSATLKILASESPLPPPPPPVPSFAIVSPAAVGVRR